MTENERQRLLLLSSPDRIYWSREGAILAGMDEVGRGPLAGPVVAGIVIMPPDPLLEWINDSKKVSASRRETVYDRIRETALCSATAWVGPEVIDRINILEATRLAFEQAFEKISLPVTDVMIDALTGLRIPAEQHILIHGDALCYSIAAASILAKVERDRYMTKQADLYPGYGFERNKGYGTKEHIDALIALGPCPLHRRSFIQKWL